jgi:hypothetical protein
MADDQRYISFTVMTRSRGGGGVIFFGCAFSQVGIGVTRLGQPLAMSTRDLLRALTPPI